MNDDDLDAARGTLGVGGLFALLVYSLLAGLLIRALT